MSPTNHPILPYPINSPHPKKLSAPNTVYIRSSFPIIPFCKTNPGSPELQLGPFPPSSPTPFLQIKPKSGRRPRRPECFHPKQPTLQIKPTPGNPERLLGPFPLPPLPPFLQNELPPPHFAKQTQSSPLCHFAKQTQVLSTSTSTFPRIKPFCKTKPILVPTLILQNKPTPNLDPPLPPPNNHMVHNSYFPHNRGTFPENTDADQNPPQGVLS